jgi:hypothetical protein
MYGKLGRDAILRETDLEVPEQRITELGRRHASALEVWPCAEFWARRPAGRKIEPVAVQEPYETGGVHDHHTEVEQHHASHRSERHRREPRPGNGRDMATIWRPIGVRL